MIRRFHLIVGGAAIAVVLSTAAAAALIDNLFAIAVLSPSAVLLGWMIQTRRREVVFDPCGANTARRMLDAARLRTGEEVVDLGCGDGRVLVMAARHYGVTGVGTEIDALLAMSARVRVRVSGVQRQVRIVRGDFHDADVSQADVVFMYLNSDANARLAPRLARQLKPTSRVVSLIHPMPGWLPAATHPSGMAKGPIHLYDRASWAHLGTAAPAPAGGVARGET